MKCLPPELILQIFVHCDYDIQLVLRECCKFYSSIFLLTPTLPYVQALARTVTLKTHVKRIHDELAEFYDLYGNCQQNNRYPSYLKKDAILVNTPHRLSTYNDFLSYLANVLLLMDDIDIFAMSLNIAINLATEPRNGLGCYILKNRKLIQKLLTVITDDTDLSEYAVLLIGNCHDHRNHVGTTCPFTGKTVASSIFLKTLADVKQTVNAYYRLHPDSEEAEFAAGMWNTTPRFI